MTLDKEQILALQYMGVDNKRIIESKDDLSDLLNSSAGRGYFAKAKETLTKEIADGVRLLAFNDPGYPQSLKATGFEAPPLIHCKGDASLLHRPAIAIIGSRKASQFGIKKAWTLGSQHGAKGDVVVSGLALGCDAAAHSGCMSSKGKTIAVVANGLDTVFPLENRFLFDKIVRDGLVISENPYGTPANAKTLVARDRIQAALSKTVIVAETSETGGSRHAVAAAGRYGKVVEAVKYKKEIPQNAGNFRMIEEGIAKERLI